MDYKNIESIEKFDKHFKKREKIELPGENIEIIDIKPKNQKTKIPVILGVGWGGQPKAYKNNILSLVNSGRRTIIIDAVHGINYDKLGKNSKELPRAELRKVAALIKVLDNKNIKKIDAVGHSEGGIYVTLAAVLHPEKFRNLVLVNPGGMIGKDRKIRLTVGFLQDLLKHFIASIGNKESLKRFSIFYGGMIKSAIKDLIKAADEISAISDLQIQKFLKKLKKKGIGIAIIHSLNDHTFPIDRMRKLIKLDHVDNFYAIKGSHGDFIMQAEKYTHVVGQALDALENKNR